MKLDRHRAQELATLLRESAPHSPAAAAIDAQLKNPATLEITVNAGWIKQPASKAHNEKLRAFAATLNDSSFTGYREMVPQSTFSKLPRFDAAKHWDMDSTPLRARLLSRKLGARPPAIEAAIIMASLKHDVRYYYGGDMAMKRAADARFANDIKEYGATLKYPRHSKVVALADELAVLLGGTPSDAPYAWGYGLPVAERAFAPLVDGQREQIEAHASEQARAVIAQLANDSYPFTAQHQTILTPEIRAHLRELARTLMARGG